MNMNYDSLRLWFQSEKREYSKRSFWYVNQQEMVFGHKNSSLPLVQVVLRGSLLHFCFDFGSASMAMLNVLPTCDAMLNEPSIQISSVNPAKLMRLPLLRKRGGIVLPRCRSWYCLLFSLEHKRFCFHLVLFESRSVELMYRLCLCNIMWCTCLFILGITAITVTPT